MGGPRQYTVNPELEQAGPNVIMNWKRRDVRSREAFDLRARMDTRDVRG